VFSIDRPSQATEIQKSGKYILRLAISENDSHATPIGMLHTGGRLLLPEKLVQVVSAVSNPGIDDIVAWNFESFTDNVSKGYFLMKNIWPSKLLFFEF
jgi:hypothetical protein